MVLDTPTAQLNVLGTRFTLVADESITRLTVKEGLVRMTRYTDNRALDVLASHQAVARIDDMGDWRVSSLENSTHSWQANLAEDATLGNWIDYSVDYRKRVAEEVREGEITSDEAARKFYAYMEKLGPGALRVEPVRSGRERGDVSYMVSLSVSATPRSETPVILDNNSRIRIRGRVTTPTELAVAFTAIELDGSAPTRFHSRAQIEGDFDIELPLSGFESTGDAAPGKELFNLFCSTSSREAELEITGAWVLAD